MKLFDLYGRKAIVTGAAQGLANGMAEGLMEAGAQVCIIDINAKAEKVAEEYCRQGFQCSAVIADLSNRDQLKTAFDEAVNKLGNQLDIIINAAGVQKRHYCEEFPIEDWDFVLEVNLNAVFQLCQLSGKQFMVQESKGKIINIASMLSFFGGYTVPAYAASKGGVTQLTKALCNEWAGKNINVNAIAPGYMATEMNTALIADEKRNAEILDRIPAHRWGKPDDIKGIAIFLASDASDYLNGAVIPCDGGYLVR